MNNIIQGNKQRQNKFSALVPFFWIYFNASSMSRLSWCSPYSWNIPKYTPFCPANFDFILWEKFKDTNSKWENLLAMWHHWAGYMIIICVFKQFKHEGSQLEQKVVFRLITITLTHRCWGNCFLGLPTSLNCALIFR